jgi:hypothetical protein
MPEVKMITKEDQITSELLDSIMNEVSNLSELSDSEVEDYMDSDISNPEAQKYLTEMFPDQDTPASHPFSDVQQLESVHFPNPLKYFILKIQHRRLKAKVKKVFCTVLKKFVKEDGQKIDWKEVLGAVLIALIPALGGGIFGALVLPIVIGLILQVARRGYSSLCHG